MPTWLTGKEAMEHLRVSKPTFYKLVKESRITPYTIPGVADPRYSREELDAMLLPMKRGFTTKVGDRYALVFAPSGHRHTWALWKHPVPANDVGVRAPVDGFQYESDASRPWDEQVEAAKQAAAEFLGLTQVD